MNQQTFTGLSICFVSNFSKTYFFHRIAGRLQKEGIKIYWIVVNSKLNNFLREHYDASAILYFNKTFGQKPATGKVGEFKINELVYGDRVLSRETGWPYNYLVNIQQPMYEFVKNNNIRFVFGEVTWAHEVLLHRMLSLKPELNSKYLSLEVLRIPDYRFAFFQDEFQSELYPVQKAPEELVVSAVIEAKKAEYVKMIDGNVKRSMSLFSRLSRAKRFFSMENVERNDPTVFFNRWLSFKRGTKEELNKELYRWVPKKNIQYLDGKKFVLLALHKQPEATIDVFGRYYENQLQNIKNVWRILPDDWFLAVKEHSNAIGDRGYLFFKEVLKLRNTVIINEKTDSHQLIRKAEAVFTVNGTIAYEAALMGKQSFTFSPAFFNRFVLCRKLSVEDIRKCNNIFELIDYTAPQKDPAATYLLNNSFEGIINDPITDERCMHEDNIELVCKAFFILFHGEHKGNR